MAQLISQSKKITLVEKLTVATSFSNRARGLIGKKTLPLDEGMWFPKSNWIHTCFMSMPIDVIYLDKKMSVYKLQPNLRPWRFPAPVLRAHSVVEVSAGFIEQNNIEIGDTLNVGN